MVTRETRREAYDSIIPEVETRRAVILRVLKMSDGMTAEEILDVLYGGGVIPMRDPNYVRPRLTELKKMGAIKPEGKRLNRSAETPLCGDWRKIMTLYEIDKTISEWEPDIDPDTGEVLNFAALDELNMARDAKIENVALYIKNLIADAKAIRDEEKALAERRKAAENKADRLKKYLAISLNGEKFSTAKVAVSYKTSAAVQTDDEFVAWAVKNAPELLRVSDPEPNKTAIKAALTGGANLPGASIVQNVSVQIR